MELLATWIAKAELRYLLSLERQHAPRSEVSNRLFAFYDWCARADVPEVTTLAMTFEPGGRKSSPSSPLARPTPEPNRPTGWSRTARIAFGFRNLNNQRRYGCTANGRSSVGRREDDQPLNL
jgi:hypothetical protein